MIIEILYIIFVVICIWYVNLKYLRSYETFYQTAYPLPDFYTTSVVPDSVSDYSLYRVEVFTTQRGRIDHVMIHIMPQDSYYFLESGMVLFHPKKPRSENYFKCSDHHFELAYILPNLSEVKGPNVQIMCHRKLSYLKKLYTRRIYLKTFSSLPDIFAILTLILKNTGIYKILNKIKKE